MKKIISFVAVSAMVSLVACGPSAEDEAKRKADSARVADSIAAIEMAAQRTADSIRMADSLAAVEVQRKADSARIADSIAAASKSTTKPKATQPKAPEGPKIGKPKPGAK
jgi:hypothetical protein